MLSQARQASGRKSSSFTAVLSAIFRASVGHTWAHTPQPLQAAGSALMFKAKRSQGMPLGGFLNFLKYRAASSTGRSVTVEMRAESGHEAVQIPQAMHLAGS